MQPLIMRKTYGILLLCFCLLLAGRAEDYQLSNGRVIKGEASSFTENGVVFKLETGSFSERISWTQFPQETLKLLSQNPKAAEFAEPFIEVPPQEKSKKDEIVVKPVERPVLPPKKGGPSGWTSPAGLAILVALMLGNVYAAYEVARYRLRPVAVVCGVSVVLPVLGPIIFLSLPTEGSTVEAPVAEAAPAAEPAAAPAKAGAGGLSVAAGGAKSGGSSSLAGSVFKRGEVTFNRRFFETQLAGFFRVVPSEAEKDLVLVFRSGRNEYIGKRISRIAANDLHLQLLTGGEVQVPFGDLIEVKVRHKDAK
ncbi:MAG TPA: hypothetical protein VHH73_06080 [Verrucomicrobiae bacterium]|nr:hypothetical protein [Verrucomicrobiae bacterium]